MKTTNRQRYSKMAIEIVGSKTDWKVDLGNTKSKINKLFWEWTEKADQLHREIINNIYKAQDEYNEVVLYPIPGINKIYARILWKEYNRFKRFQDTAARWMKRADRPWAGAPEWEAAMDYASLEWSDLF